ncbi:MAG TPA: flagellar motor switch protein FliM, partial [Leptospiraceae bacterium]|nr:flagellar motor switch protein FliM [Leptospiraceae bacterium]
MDEILTNDELDALLTAISTTSLEKSDDAPVEPKKIRTYDFKKPDKFSKDHLKSFQYIFETFSRIASPALSLKFEIPLSINFSSIDQLSYEEFSKLIPENSILGMVNLKPLHGYTIFEFEPEFTFSLIDILTGGKGDPIIKPRQLTDLELSIIQTIMHTLVSYLKESFQSVLQIKPVLEKIETNTFFKQKLYSGEIVLQVCLDLNLKGTEYSMNICLPYTS